ncbi:flavin reductase family protein [Candidatus Sumerlaeota bacterium]|nr:flavin reductase family protein [Candidatus Sumerlaeota bacterium]
MIVDPADAKPTQLYHCLIGAIAPRPIAWVSTLSPRGIPNLAPFSYFTGVGVLPPTLCFSPINRRDGSKKDTILNLRATPEFVVNVVPFALGEAMNLSSADFAYEESEFEKAGVTPAASRKVKPPCVAESPVHFECALHDIIELGTGPLAGNLVIGKILLIHVADEVLDERGEIDPKKLDLIGRMGGNWYARTREIFEMERPEA